MATFEIEIFGYGGEYVIGNLTKEQYDYWLPLIDEGDTEGLDSHLFWDPYEEGEGNPITDENDPRFLGYWHDLDNIAHSCGADAESCEIVVINADTGDEVYKTDEPTISDTEQYEYTNSGYYFKGNATEKGQFFFAEMEADKFDPSKLTVKVSNIDGNNIIDEVEYDNKYLDNDGGSTTGKGSDYEFVEIP
tara:strand:+ start:934 stop:1506 length:573 start_codon:yes stop_codon:yes gene_type:complete